MRALGAQTHEDTRIYFTGGATAVLFGWRGSTIDVDIKFVPDRDDLLRAIPSIKEDLHDVHEMLRQGLIDRVKGLEYFSAVEPFLYRYPSLDPRTFHMAVNEAFRVS